MSQGLQRITRGENPLFVLDNKHVLAVGNPPGKDLKNTFSPERLTNKRETKLFEEEGLDNINPNEFYEGGIARVKLLKRRHTSRKTSKKLQTRSNKKRKSRRSKKSKSSKVHNK